jgi:hypothetical protein
LFEACLHTIIRIGAGFPRLYPRHARACPAHPRLASDNQDVDGRDHGVPAAQAQRGPCPGHDDIRFHLSETFCNLLIQQKLADSFAVKGRGEKKLAGEKLLTMKRDSSRNRYPLELRRKPGRVTAPGFFVGANVLAACAF